MPPWLKPALQYIPQVIDHQMRQSEQPGCQLAIVHRGKVVLQHAAGLANLRSGATLTKPSMFEFLTRQSKT